jgi:hypothetical protein
MRHISRFAVLLAILALFLPTLAFAQDPGPDPVIAGLIDQSRTTTETPLLNIRIVIPGTLRESNNLFRDGDGSPLFPDSYRQFGMLRTQQLITLFGRLPAGQFSSVTFSLEGTDRSSVIRVARSGRFSARLNVADLPPGTYFILLNGVRVASVIAPEPEA